ncbi:hypothetical protein Tco_0085116 [Tanacetum coccineum]
MSEEDQHIDVGTLPKFDMPLYTSDMTAKDVKSFALRHGIPLDLHPVALTKEWTMDKLSDDMIGLVEPIDDVRVVLSKSKYCPLHVNDPCPEDVFIASDVQMLTEEVVDFRPVPSGLLFLGALATTWDFPMVTMSEYLRFPFLSDASISKGVALTSQDQIEQHTVRPLLPDQAIPEKTDHQKRVEVEDPKIIATRERKARAAAKKKERKRQGGNGGGGGGGGGSRCATKRKKTAARKDGPAASKATSSPEPIKTINPTNPSAAVAETAESREDRSPSVSPHGSAGHSVHNYDAHHGDGETRTLRLGASGDPSGQAMNHVDTEVVQPFPSP